MWQVLCYQIEGEDELDSKVKVQGQPCTSGARRRKGLVKLRSSEKLNLLLPTIVEA